MCAFVCVSGVPVCVCLDVGCRDRNHKTLDERCAHLKLTV